MQDAKQIEEQTLERIAAAETRASVAQNHSHLAGTRRADVEVQVVKFKILQEAFNVGRQVLEQRKGSYQTAEQPVPPGEMAGLEQAITEMENVIQQVRVSVARHEGALQALHEMEMTFKTEADKARGMGRGAEVAGGRATELAARSGEILAAGTAGPAPEPPAEADEGVGSLLDVLQGEGVEDQPIDAPQTTGTGSKRAPRRKAE